MATSVLTLEFVLSGCFYQYTGAGNPGSGYGHYQVGTKTTLNRQAYHLDFSEAALSTSSVYDIGMGFAVPHESFPHLLSGSYGLAVRSGTNRDTAMLTIEFYRNGQYYSDRANYIGNSFGLFWESRVWDRNSARRLYYHSTDGIQAASTGYKESGYVVRGQAINLLLIFSPEAMGWLWEILRTRIRRR